MHSVSVVANEQVELMEISRIDFDRILKADVTSEFGRTIDFLSRLSIMDGVSVANIHSLAHAVTRKTYMRDQLCFAHPPDPFLGPLSYSYDYIYLIYSGEARLMCGVEERPQPSLEVEAKFGPLVGDAPPQSARVERHLGSSVAPVATLGPGEVIFDNLLQHPTTRWCLKPVTHWRSSSYQRGNGPTPSKPPQSSSSATLLDGRLPSFSGTSITPSAKRR